MGDKDILASELEFCRLPNNLHATLALEVVAHPHIVVTDEEVDFYPLVAQLGQLAQRADEALGDNFTILPPKVKDVTDQKYGGGIFGYTI